LRYRVVVIPGSGCAGMGSLADRYFRGLLHAQVTVLHKPGVHPEDTTAPADCPPHFVQTDSLSRWAAHTRAALGQIAAMQPSARVGSVPLLLVGISEGVELLPTLAAAAGPDLAGLVMISGSGLDPREAGRLQALRKRHGADWEILERMQASAASDAAVHQGRSLRYWRDLWRWPVQQPLIHGPWPLLQVWGEQDGLVPAAAYQAFAQMAQQRAAPYCTRSLPGADHGLQAPDLDGVQQVWQWVQQWGRAPGAGLCAPLASP
jgi:dienelactone hydrolase